MNNPLEELEKQFNAFIELKDSEEFFLAFTEHLRSIQETPELHTIARKILSDGNLSEINSLYKTLQRAWQEDDKAAEKIWGDINRKSLGLSTKYDISLLGRFSERQMVGGIIRVFHSGIVEDAKKKGLAKGKRAITKDVDGDYYYKGKKLPFKKDAIYAHIFDYLYDLADGEASYDNINTYLARMGKGTMGSKFDQSERIRNAIKVYEKDKKFPKTIGGLRMLEVRHGYGMRLNNPEV